MVRTQALFTKFYVTQLNLHPPPPKYDYGKYENKGLKIDYSTRTESLNTIKKGSFSNIFNSSLQKLIIDLSKTNCRCKVRLRLRLNFYLHWRTAREDRIFFLKLDLVNLIIIFLSPFPRAYTAGEGVVYKYTR